MKLLITIGLLLTGVSAWACDEDAKIGYWWYCEPPPAETETTPTRTDLPPPPSADALMQMHPDDLAALQERYLKQAVWRLEPQAVQEYYQVVDAARKKSLAFTAVSDLVLLENPDLNAWGQYQKTNPGRKAVTQQHNAQINALLRQQSDQFGLLLFTRPGCVFCQSQRVVLAAFAERHGWPVKTIDVQKNPLMAARFNIDYVPVTILAQKDAEAWMPVAVGEAPLTSVEASVYRAIRYLQGKTTPRQFLQLEYQDGSAMDPEARGAR
ncbi:MAG: conjugal transfer protein TraF [Gammaproteobacteria bacterium]